MIQHVYSALATADTGGAVRASPRPKPAVPIGRSVKPNYIVCLEDGKKLKRLCQTKLNRHAKAAGLRRSGR